MKQNVHLLKSNDTKQTLVKKNFIDVFIHKSTNTFKHTVVYKNINAFLQSDKASEEKMALTRFITHTTINGYITMVTLNPHILIRHTW